VAVDLLNEQMLKDYKSENNWLHAISWKWTKPSR